ncbi:MAG TPA: DUF4010 domain-containing protein, partial [Vicinamibacterales bacterium]|nr:DUF4010 domain-containing protein [Vicinamibacterales bacterium]
SAGVAAVLVAGAVLLVVISYIATSKRGFDATTEAAGLIVIGAGFAAGLGWIALASGIIAISTLLLVEKSSLHALVGRIDDEELRAAARFGVMAIVILPLLPEGPYGPLGGIKPRELWLLVLFFTGLSFLGYFARRIFGATRGYPLAGLLAGMVSSTNATFTFARMSRREAQLSQPLAVGAIAACTMLFPRVVAATFVLDYRVAIAVLPYLAAPFFLGLLSLARWWRANPVPTPQATVSNPLQIGPALQMAATFQAVLFAVDLARRWFGDAGLLVSGAVLGITDVDALTISMTKSATAGVDPWVAAQAIATGILVNCAMKTVLAVALGTRKFSRSAGPAIAAMGVAIAVAIAVAR